MPPPSPEPVSGNPLSAVTLRRPRVTLPWEPGLELHQLLPRHLPLINPCSVCVPTRMRQPSLLPDSIRSTRLLTLASLLTIRLPRTSDNWMWTRTMESRRRPVTSNLLSKESLRPSNGIATSCTSPPIAGLRARHSRLIKPSSPSRRPWTSASPRRRSSGSPPAARRLLASPRPRPISPAPPSLSRIP